MGVTPCDGYSLVRVCRREVTRDSSMPLLQLIALLAAVCVARAKADVYAFSASLLSFSVVILCSSHGISERALCVALFLPQDVT